MQQIKKKHCKGFKSVWCWWNGGFGNIVMLVSLKEPGLMLMLSCLNGMRQNCGVWLGLKVLGIFGRNVVWSLGS